MQTQNIVKIIACISFSFLTQLQCLGQNTEEAIRECFENYKSAILKDSGDVAVTYVSKKTISYYDNLLNATISADSISLNKMTLVDRMMVLMIRQTTPLETLEPMDGKALLSFAVQRGMVGKSGIQNQGVGVIKVNKGVATGIITIEGNPSGNALDYYLEEGAWKVDLTSAFPPANSAFASMIKNAGKSENEYLIMSVEFVTSRKAIPGIWHPLK